MAGKYEEVLLKEVNKEVNTVKVRERERLVLSK